MNELLRACEAGTDERRAACCLFWTLGANQVGKGALTGWREQIIPLMEGGAKLWPFDGALAGVVGNGARLVLAETYPAEAYGHLGVTFAPGESKRRQKDREGKAPRLLAWAADRQVNLSKALRAAIEQGFAANANGEDQFDALIGLCGMLEVVAFERPEGAPRSGPERAWEGWILGMSSTGQDRRSGNRQ